MRLTLLVWGLAACSSADPGAADGPLTHLDASDSHLADAAADAAVAPLDPDALTADAALPDAIADPVDLDVHAERLVAVSAETLRTLVDPAVVIDNGYAVYALTYLSAGADAHATVTVPDGPAPAGGWHVVANAHGTTGADDPCALFGTDWAIGNAGLFGARGLIGVAPEYPGLGTPGVHPYLVAESEGRAVLDALRATSAFAAQQAIPVSGRHALVGFSQGGHAALSAAALRADYAPNVDLRAVAVAAPASVWPEHWSAGLAFDGPHLVYHALLAWTWATHYQVDGPLWADGFDADEAFSTRCVFDPAGQDSLSAVVPQTGESLFHPAFLTAWRTLEWRDYPGFGAAFAANRLAPFTQSGPIKVYQGSADQVVPASQTEALVAALRAADMAVDYELVEGGQHGDIAFGVLAFPQQRTEGALAWLRAALAE